MSKHCLANTPLILQDEHGNDIRIERGETVLLSPEQYELVAAHVTPLDTDTDVVVNTVADDVGDQDTANESESSEPEPSPPTTEPPAKPQHGKAKAAE